ncbi:MAG: SDR family oxidoreductase [Sandaracinaceae bacterium]|nr:SDR family oxidoreductase [Sandaracinaceae bacterium]
MIELAHKRALVTGAGKRVGAAVATALGRAQMHVAVHYHGSREGALETCLMIEQAGGRATPFAADLSDRADARKLVENVLATFGGLDLLVASAANFDRVELDQIDDAAWDRALALNLTAPFVLAHAAKDALRKAGGSIVFVTCTSATTPYRNYLPYVVSKGALQKMMRVLALELAPHVRVNAIAPGTVLPPADLDAAAIELLASRIPLRKIGTPDDIACAVIFLAQSSSITGAELFVDGGRVGAGNAGEGAV